VSSYLGQPFAHLRIHANEIGLQNSFVVQNHDEAAQ
jgi:hypothetical protein